MSKKSEKILDVANQLFFEQGYRGTNMQSIADACSISKGAIYLHFKSKEQILIGLLKRMDDQLFAKLESIESDSTLSARNRFKAQIKCQIDLSTEQKQLSDLFIQDAMAFTEELHDFAGETRHRWQLAQKRAVVEYFGEQVIPWQVDVSLIVSGILNEYASYWLLENIELPLDKMIEMVVFSCEHIVQGMIEHQPQAVMNEGMMPNSQSLEEDAEERRQSKLQKLVKELGALIPPLQQDADENEWHTLSSTGEVLLELIQQEQPNLVMLRALLASLREYSSLYDTRREIAKLFNVKLV